MSVTPTTEKETRRINRLGLAVPVRVECRVDQKVTWNEITRLSDVSQFGAGFNLPRPVKRGRLIHMTIPMPRQLRNYDYIEPQYRVWGLVRHCVPFKRSPISPQTYAIGTAFIGKNPPEGFMENPAKLYDAFKADGEPFWHLTDADLKADDKNLPKEYRRHSRYGIPVNIMLELLDGDGQVQTGEISVTENISLSGASIFSTIPAEVGSFVRVTSDQYNASIVAVVRGRRAGEDGFPRLHLEFIDRYFPLEGIE